MASYTLLRQLLMQLSVLTTSLIHFLYEWFGEFAFEGVHCSGHLTLYCQDTIHSIFRLLEQIRGYGHLPKVQTNPFAAILYAKHRFHTLLLAIVKS